MLFTVVGVPITPILLFLVMLAAFLAPGLITPMIGILNLFFNAGNAMLEALLHATIISLTLNRDRNSAFSIENRFMVSLDFVPYGTLAVSPKYTIRSFGRAFIISLTTVSPPTPESNMPMGLLFIVILHNRLL